MGHSAADELPISMLTDQNGNLAATGGVGHQKKTVVPEGEDNPFPSSLTLLPAGPGDGLDPHRHLHQADQPGSERRNHP